MEGTAPPQANAVGECYLEMFFSKLFEAPRDVHRFYKNPSQLTVVFTDEPAKEVTARGQKQVNDFFSELDLLGWEAPETLRQVTYQETFNHSVLIHHNSVLRHTASGRTRKVSQTILLAVEPDSPSYDHYFVLNDILVLSPVETDAPAEEPVAAAAAVAEAEAEPVVEETPVVEAEAEAEAEPVPVPVAEPVVEPVVEETPAAVAEPVVEEAPAAVATVVVAAPIVEEPAKAVEEPAATPAPVEPAAPKTAAPVAAPVAAAGPTPAQAAKIVRPQEPVQTGPPSFAQLLRKNLPTNFVPVPQPEAVNPPAPLPVVEKKKPVEAAADRKPYPRSTERTAESSQPKFDFSVHIPELPEHTTEGDIEKLILPLVAGKVRVRKGESTTYANIFVASEKLMKSVAEAVQAKKAHFEGFELKAIERRPRPAQANGNGDARPKPRTAQKSQTPK